MNSPVLPCCRAGLSTPGWGHLAGGRCYSLWGSRGHPWALAACARAAPPLPPQAGKPVNQDLSQIRCLGTRCGCMQRVEGTSAPGRRRLCLPHSPKASAATCTDQLRLGVPWRVFPFPSAISPSSIPCVPQLFILLFPFLQPQHVQRNGWGAEQSAGAGVEPVGFKMSHLHQNSQTAGSG